MKKLFLVILLISIAACSKTPDLIVKGNIKGLKKGTVFLKKIKDTTFITIDSMIINGNSQFELHSNLNAPEVLYLFLNKNTNQDDAIAFFADKGVTEINTTLKNFNFDAIIKGSTHQEKWDDYKSMISKFNNKNLDLLKQEFEALKENDTAEANSIKKEINSLIKRKYLFTVNFALNNKDSEIAPFLTLSEIYNIKTSFLDTINNSLSPEIKVSKYGKELNNYIKILKNK